MTLTTLTEFEERSLKTGAQALFPRQYLSSFKRITVVLSVPDARAISNLLHAKKKDVRCDWVGPKSRIKRVEKSICVTRDGSKIYSVTRDWTQLSAWRATGQHNVMRDLLFCKRMMRDLQDFLLEFRDKWTPFNLEGYQSSKVNRVITKINKTWHPCHCFLVLSVLSKLAKFILVLAG